MVDKTVFDNSVMMPLFLPDEDPGKALEILKTADEGNPLLCPSLWVYEFGNVLSTALRRKRISMDNLSDILRLADQLPIQIASPPALSELNFQVIMSHRYGLSFYDTSYLVLAYKEGAALATLDKNMQKAARQNDVRLI